MGHAQRHEVRLIDAQLARNPVDLPFLRRRDRIVGGRHREQAAHQRQLLVVVGHRGKLSRDEEIRRSGEQSVVGLRQMHDDDRLIGAKPAMLGDERFHDARFLGRDVFVGVRHAPEQVGERAEITRAVGLEAVERLERVAQRLEIRGVVGPLQAQP